MTAFVMDDSIPMMASVATSIGQNPFLLIISSGLAASCAFMLPVATPPNAIVYSSKKIEIVHMVKLGILLDLMFAIFITLFTFIVLPILFNVEIGVIPPWATH